MKEPIINIGILTNYKIQFELYGDFYISKETINKSSLTSQSSKIYSGEFIAERKGNKIQISSGNDVLEFEDEVIFNPSVIETEFFTLIDVSIGIEFHWERKEKQKFKGLLKFIKDKDKITAVNIINVEEYLRSVISSEMSARSAVESLKAHSVISRSWLLAQIEKSKKIKEEKTKEINFIQTDEELINWYDREEHELYDVCADDHCQRYQGITKIISDNVMTAVNDTNGLVLTYEDEICDTRFSKSCGGISEEFQNVWEPSPKPYLTSIIDYKYEPENFNLDLTKEENAKKWIMSKPPAFCNTQDKNILSQVLMDFDQITTDFYRWHIEYSQQELSELINTKSGINFGEIIDLIPIERGKSGRLIKLKIVGTNKSLIIGKELVIRRWLSKSHLYSSAFVVEKKNIKNNVPQKFIIYGAGWGHGVGLCQIGAAVMSNLGYFFDEILYHYYPEASLKKIY